VGVAVADHLQVDVFSADEDRAEDASVLVLGLPRYSDVFAEDVVRELLLRLLPEGLGLFGSVDRVKADLVLDVGGVKNRERVAIGDAYDSSTKLRPCRR
jgi:hypothetical protein